MHSVKILLSILFFLISSVLKAQEVIVAEIDDFIEGKQEFTYGFTPGDKVTYTIQTLKGSADEIQIIEYPKNVRYKSTKLPDQFSTSYTLQHGGFLTLRMIKLSTGKCHVKIMIKRTPAEEQYADFNTAIVWETVNDTSWKGGKPAPTFYDTTYTYKPVKRVASTDTLFVTVVDRVEVLPLGTTASPAVSTVNIKLPYNSKDSTHSKELLSWAYFIGTGDDAENAWNKANVSFLPQLSAQEAAGYTAGDLLDALSAGVVSAISLRLVLGSFIQYKIAYTNNLGETHTIDNGSTPLAYGSANFPKQGAFSIILKNNQPEELKAHLIIRAAIVQKMYATEIIKLPKQIMRKETIVSSYKVAERKVPHHPENRVYQKRIRDLIVLFTSFSFSNTSSWVWASTSSTT